MKAKRKGSRFTLKNAHLLVVAAAYVLNILQQYASLEALLRLASGAFLSVN